MIEALLISVDEPQLERCLESIKNQTVPFSNLIHINNVCPHHVAYNQGLSMLKDEWFMSIAGDFVLYPDAVQKVTKEIREGDEKIVAHLHHNYDAFLGDRWPGLGTFKTDVVKKIRFSNRLNCDRKMGETLHKNGWGQIRHHGFLGIHFDKPDEYQVFRRFYVIGLKFNWIVVNRMTDKLKDLFKQTNNPLYIVALKSLEFAEKKRSYPGSHNIEFEKELYKEFKNGHQ